MPSQFKVEARASEVHGMGLFALETIPRGALIGACTTEPTRRRNKFTLTLTRGDVHVRCELRYINHGRPPNVAYLDDATVVALRRVRPGEELLHDYGDDWA